ncbi:MAG TPA: class I SAM-dependent methyltransferase [Solirubrobacterales bacterium]|nr:class I SAM-dependent methyltransferase [Solirubrobacterales bacterium]
MTDGWLGGDLAEDSNNRFASAYDDFNKRYQNTRWTGRLLERAEAAGLQGNRLLDVACGTGLSFIPMLRRDFLVTGCDVSSAMLDIAREKVGDLAELRKADMRELPIFGPFDLVWAVNDPINYLLSMEELVACLKGMRRNLAGDGIIVFDVNTLNTYRTFFAETLTVEVNSRKLVWTGLANPREARPGMIAEARFEAAGEADSVHLHKQRHFGEDEVREALKVAGLNLVEVSGEANGDLLRPLDEEVHGKAVYVCKARTQESLNPAAGGRGD